MKFAANVSFYWLFKIAMSKRNDCLTASLKLILILGILIVRLVEDLETDNC